MATQYTSLLGLALPVTGELSGSWGDTVNIAITSLLDTAVAGTTSLTTDADVTLTTTTGLANQARQAIILWNPASGTVTRNITAPAQSKIYTVINASGGTQSIVIRGAGPTTGVTIIKGESAVVAWNGTDFIKVSNTGGAGSFTNLTVTGNLTVNSLTNTRVPYASTSGLLVDSANMTFNGTRLTVADLADSGLTSGRVTYASTGGALVDSANLTFDGTNLTLGGGTANGVAYLNGSKVLTTGSALTFDGTTLSNTGSGDRAKFGTGVRNLFIAGDSNGVSLFDAAGQTGNGFYINGASNFIAGYIASSEQMRLTSTGLGIGTSSPQARFQATGNGILGNASASSTGLYLVADWDASLDAVAQISADFFGNIRISAAKPSTGSNPVSATYTDRLVIDNAGNLGLGVTPSAWQSGRAALQIGSGTSTSLYNTGNGSFLANNMYVDTSGVFRYIGAGVAQRYALGSDGTHTWGIAASGSANAVTTLTQAMTLDASGNLILGTTASASARLYVRGSGTTSATASFEASNSSGATRLYVQDDGTTRFFGSAGSETARITSGGNLLVGTTDSSMAGLSGIRLGAGNAGVVLAEGGTNRGYLFNSTIAASISLESVSGTTIRVVSGGTGGVSLANGATSWASLSDERHKDIIEPISNAADKVASLRAVIGKYKTDEEGTRRSFLIAQDVQAVLPEAIDNTDAENLALRYSDLTPLLVAAIQEQQAIITALTARVAALESN